MTLSKVEEVDMTRKKTGGRKAGTPNKVSNIVPDNVIAVFDEIGGNEAMAEWAKDNRTEYYRLWSKLLPKQINSDISTEPNSPEPLTDNELTTIIRQGHKLKVIQ